MVVASPTRSGTGTSLNTSSRTSGSALLFGESSSTLSARRHYYNPNSSHNASDRAQADDDDDGDCDDQGRISQPPTKGSLADFFFGFMYQEENLDQDDDDILYRSSTSERTTAHLLWNNPVNATLFVSLALNSAAAAVPVTLVSAMNQHLQQQQQQLGSTAAPLETTNSIAPRLAAAAVLGTSLGKLINGPVSDLVGARRTSTLYSILLALSLTAAAAATTPATAAWACFWVEFTYSVQWPATVITLAAHYRGNTVGMYEGGILVTSFSARAGSLLSILVGSYLQSVWSWRLVALCGAWTALVASSVTYLHGMDAPEKVNDAQNPIDWPQLNKWFETNTITSTSTSPVTTSGSSSQGQRYHGTSPRRRRRLDRLGRWLGMARWIFQTNVWPSIRHIGQSGTFWIVAVAHTGASMVRTSERILGSYLYETNDLGSNNNDNDSNNPTHLSQDDTTRLTVFLSIGTVLGLFIAGSAFASRPDRPRKWLVWRLYLVSISACYMLAFLAIPAVGRLLVYIAPELLEILQVVAICAAGFGIAVPFYHIPSLVGASYGCDKGLFAAYTDGVGYGLASIVWGVVGDSVQNNDRVASGGGGGAGWAYGWAAVALLLVLSAILMVEFMEHYFCRHWSGGTYETIIFA